MKYLAVGLYVKDFERAYKFYTEILGFESKTIDMNNKFAEVKLDNLVISLLTKETIDGMCGSSALSTNGSTPPIIALEVPNIEEAVQALSAKNVEVIAKPKVTAWGQKVAYFKDPEGYIWELSEPFVE